MISLLNLTPFNIQKFVFGRFLTFSFFNFSTQSPQSVLSSSNTPSVINLHHIHSSHLTQRKSLVQKYWKYAFTRLKTSMGEKRAKKRVVVLSKAQREFFKNQLNSIFLKLQKDKKKPEKLKHPERRLYQNIILGLDFDVLKKEVSSIVQNRLAQKQIKKKGKEKATGWNKFFGKSVADKVTEEERMEIAKIVETIATESQNLLKAPDNYCHTQIFFNQEKFGFKLLDELRRMNSSFHKLFNIPYPPLRILTTAANWKQKTEWIVSKINFEMKIRRKGNSIETRLSEIAGFYFFKEPIIDKRRSSTLSQAGRFTTIKEPLLYSKVKYNPDKLGGLTFQQQVGDMTKKPIFLNKLCGQYLSNSETNSEWARNWLVGSKGLEEREDSEFFFLQIEDPVKKHRFNISKRIDMRMGSIKYIHNQKAILFLEDLFSLSTSNSEVRSFLKEKQDSNLKKAEDISKKTYYNMSEEPKLLLFSFLIRSPEIVFPLRLTNKALIFIPGKFCFGSRFEGSPETPKTIFRADIQKTSLNFHRSSRLSMSDSVEILQSAIKWEEERVREKRLQTEEAQTRFSTDAPSDGTDKSSEIHAHPSDGSLFSRKKDASSHNVSAFGRKESQELKHLLLNQSNKRDSNPILLIKREKSRFLEKIVHDTNFWAEICFYDKKQEISLEISRVEVESKMEVISEIAATFNHQKKESQTRRRSRIKSLKSSNLVEGNVMMQSGRTSEHVYIIITPDKIWGFPPHASGYPSDAEHIFNFEFGRGDEIMFNEQKGLMRFQRKRNNEIVFVIGKNVKSWKTKLAKLIKRLNRWKMLDSYSVSLAKNLGGEDEVPEQTPKPGSTTTIKFRTQLLIFNLITKQKSLQLRASELCANLKIEKSNVALETSLKSIALRNLSSDRNQDYLLSSQAEHSFERHIQVLAAEIDSNLQNMENQKDPFIQHFKKKETKGDIEEVSGQELSSEMEKESVMMGKSFRFEGSQLKMNSNQFIKQVDPENDNQSSSHTNKTSEKLNKSQEAAESKVIEILFQKHENQVPTISIEFGSLYFTFEPKFISSLISEFTPLLPPQKDPMSETLKDVINLELLRKHLEPGNKRSCTLNPTMKLFKINFKAKILKVTFISMTDLKPYIPLASAEVKNIWINSFIYDHAFQIDLKIPDASIQDLSNFPNTIYDYTREKIIPRKIVTAGAPGKPIALKICMRDPLFYSIPKWDEITVEGQVPSGYIDYQQGLTMRIIDYLIEVLFPVIMALDVDQDIRSTSAQFKNKIFLEHKLGSWIRIDLELDNSRITLQSPESGEVLTLRAKEVKVQNQIVLCSDRIMQLQGQQPQGLEIEKLHTEDYSIDLKSVSAEIGPRGQEVIPPIDFGIKLNIVMGEPNYRLFFDTEVTTDVANWLGQGNAKKKENHFREKRKKAKEEKEKMIDRFNQKQKGIIRKKMSLEKEETGIEKIKEYNFDDDEIRDTKTPNEQFLNIDELQKSDSDDNQIPKIEIIKPTIPQSPNKIEESVIFRESSGRPFIKYENSIRLSLNIKKANLIVGNKDWMAFLRILERSILYDDLRNEDFTENFLFREKNRIRKTILMEMGVKEVGLVFLDSQERVGGKVSVGDLKIACLVEDQGEMELWVSIRELQGVSWERRGNQIWEIGFVNLEGEAPAIINQNKRNETSSVGQALMSSVGQCDQYELRRKGDATRQVGEICKGSERPRELFTARSEEENKVSVHFKDTLKFRSVGCWINQNRIALLPKAILDFVYIVGNQTEYDKKFIAMAEIWNRHKNRYEKRLFKRLEERESHEGDAQMSQIIELLVSGMDNCFLLQNLTKEAEILLKGDFEINRLATGEKKRDQTLDLEEEGELGILFKALENKSLFGRSNLKSTREISKILMEKSNRQKSRRGLQLSRLSPELRSNLANDLGERERLQWMEDIKADRLESSLDVTFSNIRITLESRGSKGLEQRRKWSLSRADNDEANKNEIDFQRLLLRPFSGSLNLRDYGFFSSKLGSLGDGKTSTLGGRSVQTSMRNMDLSEEHDKKKFDLQEEKKEDQFEINFVKESTLYGNFDKIEMELSIRDAEVLMSIADAHIKNLLSHPFIKSDPSYQSKNPSNLSSQNKKLTTAQKLKKQKSFRSNANSYWEMERDLKKIRSVDVQFDKGIFISLINDYKGVINRTFMLSLRNFSILGDATEYSKYSVVFELQIDYFNGSLLCWESCLEPTPLAVIIEDRLEHWDDQIERAIYEALKKEEEVKASTRDIKVIKEAQNERSILQQTLKKSVLNKSVLELDPERKINFDAKRIPDRKRLFVRVVQGIKFYTNASGNIQIEPDEHSVMNFNMTLGLMRQIWVFAESLGQIVADKNSKGDDNTHETRIVSSELAAGNQSHSNQAKGSIQTSKPQESGNNIEPSKVEAPHKIVNLTGYPIEVVFKEEDYYLTNKLKLRTEERFLRLWQIEDGQTLEIFDEMLSSPFGKEEGKNNKTKPKLGSLSMVSRSRTEITREKPLPSTGSILDKEKTGNHESKDPIASDILGKKKILENKLNMSTGRTKSSVLMSRKNLSFSRTKPLNAPSRRETLLKNSPNRFSMESIKFSLHHPVSGIFHSKPINLQRNLQRRINLKNSQSKSPKMVIFDCKGKANCREIIISSTVRFSNHLPSSILHQQMIRLDIRTETNLRFYDLPVGSKLHIPFDHSGGRMKIWLDKQCLEHPELIFERYQLENQNAMRSVHYVPKSSEAEAKGKVSHSTLHPMANNFNFAIRFQRDLGTFFKMNFDLVPFFEFKNCLPIPLELIIKTPLLQRIILMNPGQKFSSLDFRIDGFFEIAIGLGIKKTPNKGKRKSSLGNSILYPEIEKLKSITENPWLWYQLYSEPVMVFSKSAITFENKQVLTLKSKISKQKAYMILKRYDSQKFGSGFAILCDVMLINETPYDFDIRATDLSDRNRKTFVPKVEFKRMFDMSIDPYLGYKSDSFYSDVGI